MNFIDGLSFEVGLLQIRAERGIILTKRFEQRPRFGRLGLQLNLEIALSGVSAKVKPPTGFSARPKVR